MKYIIDFIASLITLLLGLKCVSIFFKTKIRINITNVIVILIGLLSLMFYSYYGNNVTRPLNSLIVLFICALLVFKQSVYKTLLYVLICSMLIGIYEIVLSLLFVNFNIVNLNSFDNNYIFKAIFSFVILFMVFLTVRNTKIVNLSNKLVNNNKLTKFISFVMILFILTIMILDYKYSQKITYEVYISNLILIVCILIFLFIVIKDHVQVQKEINKSEILLNFMNKYEKTIDNNREYNHELLNNLLILKSIKNKNSKGYNELLDELINNFTNKGTRIKNIYDLPSGIKGIFYYKLYGLDENNYDININVSKGVKKSIKKINHDYYITLSKIIAIILDNAIEACSRTNNKIIIIDIYSEENNIIFDITNSYKGKIDINIINEKNYSTKGKNKGYGLYIMNKLLKNNKYINVEQSVNNSFFSTKIIIKEK